MIWEAAEFCVENGKVCQRHKLISFILKDNVSSWSFDKKIQWMEVYFYSFCWFVFLQNPSLQTTSPWWVKRQKWEGFSLDVASTVQVRALSWNTHIHTFLFHSWPVPNELFNPDTLHSSHAKSNPTHSPCTRHLLKINATWSLTPACPVLKHPVCCCNICSNIL